jgi:D-serine deaminase-like pyridoxal phosphate-dependent protein
MHYTELDTPALALDLDVLEKNISDLQRECDRLEINLRVHTKNHKTPEIARLQVAAGAKGIVCQKLGEAEVMVEGGLDDILIPYNIVGRPKVERLTRLIKQDKAIITVAADSVTTVEGLNAQAVQDGCTIRVIVEMDAGGHRCGVQSPQETLELAQLIDRLPGLHFTGIMTYAVGPTVGPFFDEVRDLTAKAGLPLEMISAGCTGAQEFCKSIGCTETRIGSYVCEGLTRVTEKDDLHPGRCPLAMVVTVVSTAVPGQVVVDAGKKAFTSNPPLPYGYCREHPAIFIKGMSVEHGIVDITHSSHQFEVGEVISFIPQHAGMTINLHDHLYPMRYGEVVDTWKVAGRGRSH